MKPILFISDLHLSEDTLDLNQQFQRFLDEIAVDAYALYILGDFFDYWIGDDLADEWALSIAASLQKLAKKGVKLYFLPGNRDFLMGNSYLTKAGCELLPDPTFLKLDNHTILLKHGDDLCRLDKKHQWFRRLTRMSLITRLFLSLPAKLRKRIACFLRDNSGARTLPRYKMQVGRSDIVKELKRNSALVMIHGHTHTPMIDYYQDKQGTQFQHIILPDWGSEWGYLCYTCINSFQLVINKLGVSHHESS